MKCFHCGKEIDSDELILFCSKDCEEQFLDEFNSLVDNLDTEIPD